MVWIMTRETSDLSLSERSIGSAHWMSCDRMIRGERLIKVQRLPALHLFRSKDKSPRCCHSLHASIYF